MSYFDYNFLDSGLHLVCTTGPHRVLYMLSATDLLVAFK